MTILRALSLCAALLPLSFESFAECSANTPESFNDFLPIFSASRPFAIERTQLPLIVVRWVEGIDFEGKNISGPEQYHLSLAEYWRWPTLTEYIQAQSLDAKIESQNETTATLSLTRAGAGRRAAYHFVADVGCWFLARYEDKPI